MSQTEPIKTKFQRKISIPFCRHNRGAAACQNPMTSRPHPQDMPVPKPRSLILAQRHHETHCRRQRDQSSTSGPDSSPYLCTIRHLPARAPRGPDHSPSASHHLPSSNYNQPHLIAHSSLDPLARLSRPSTSLSTYHHISGRQEVVAQTAAGFLQADVEAMVGAEWLQGCGGRLRDAVPSAPLLWGYGTMIG